MIEYIPHRRLIGECFYIIVDPEIHNTDEALKQEMARAKAVEETVKLMLNGELPVDEMVELLELGFGKQFDKYLQEVEENIEYTFNLYPQLEHAY